MRTAESLNILRAMRQFSAKQRPRRRMLEPRRPGEGENQVKSEAGPALLPVSPRRTRRRGSACAAYRSSGSRCYATRVPQPSVVTPAGPARGEMLRMPRKRLHTVAMTRAACAAPGERNRNKPCRLQKQPPCGAMPRLSRQQALPPASRSPVPCPSRYTQRSFQTYVSMHPISTPEAADARDISRYAQVSAAESARCQ